MGTLAQIRTGLATAADTVTGLRCYPYVPLKPELPAFIAGWPTEFDPLQVEGDAIDYVIPCHLVVPFRQDRSSDTMLMGYLAPSGAGSVLAAIAAAPTLGGACDSCAVMDGGANIFEGTLRDGVTDVLTCTIQVQVFA